MKQSMKKIISILVLCALLISGCGSQPAEQQDSEASDSEETVTEVDFSLTDQDMFTERDSRTTYENQQTVIYLQGASASCASAAVSIDGGVITISDEGTYVVEGTLDEGMIIVNAEETDKPQIVLRGASITSATSAPIYIVESDKVFVTLEEGTENVLTNGGSLTVIQLHWIILCSFTAARNW